MVRRVRVLCVQRAAGVRPGQLRFQVSWQIIHWSVNKDENFCSPFNDSFKFTSGIICFVSGLTRSGVRSIGSGSWWSWTGRRPAPGRRRVGSLWRSAAPPAPSSGGGLHPASPAGSRFGLGRTLLHRVIFLGLVFIWCTLPLPTTIDVDVKVWSHRNFHFQAKKIDVFSRVAFPFAFGVFNVLYWSHYLTMKQGKPTEWVATPLLLCDDVFLLQLVDLFNKVMYQFPDRILMYISFTHGARSYPSSSLVNARNFSGALQGLFRQKLRNKRFRIK